jgi:4-amino-4-deoxy-L-arabinose transferase-like glycosyltransferase
LKSAFFRIAFSLAILLTVPTLIKDGMFMDAMLYTSVSHNLANGIGTFWFPQFSLHNLAGLSSFHEQPPLVFGIQSLFFKLFGDSMYVERFYVFLTMLLNALLIIYLWKMIFGEEKLRRISWLPVLLWILIPVCFWSFSNNMHENTMSIFILCAVIFIVKETRLEHRQISYSIAAGIFIFLATLSKGIPGLFPVGVPLFYWIVFERKNFKRYFIQSVIIAFTVLCLYAILLMFTDARESLYIYLTKRALNRINEVPTVASRFYILGRIVSELLPHLILLIIYFLVNGYKRTVIELSREKKMAAFFMMIGLAGSAPLMLTMVQKGFYFVPSLPYFAIGFAMLFKEPVLKFSDFIFASASRQRTFSIISYLFVIAAIVISLSQIGKYSREKELLNDISKLTTVVPDHSTLSTTPALWNQWNLQCYLMRYHFISLEDRRHEQFYLAERSDNATIPSGYIPVALELSNFKLYRRGEK